MNNYGNNNEDNNGVVILAAGMGKRMQSSLPKVLHPLCGKPLLFHILEKLKKVNPKISVGLLLGHGREQVEAYVQSESLDSLGAFHGMDISFLIQEHQQGTGHGLRCALDSPWGQAKLASGASILVLPGDLPLITEDLIHQMLEPLGQGFAMRLLTSHLSQPRGYGRVLRSSPQGSVIKIVEEKDATEAEKLIHEISASIYLFSPQFLAQSIHKISTKNAQNEHYLTDLIEIAATQNLLANPIDVLQWTSEHDLQGVNDSWELAQAQHLKNQSLLRAWALIGVQFIHPQSVRVDCTVSLGAGSIIYPGVFLEGRTSLGESVRVESNVVLRNVQVGSGVSIKTGTVAEDSVIHSHAAVGPYAHLRPGTVIGEQSKIGNFVELKKTKVGQNSSIAHLSYLGDAEVGNHVNIGCGFVTCNFDGRIIDGERKHRTWIEDHAFIGSDCQAVAPIRIGRGAFVASGSTITQNIEQGALAIARSRQINKAGYAKKFHKSEPKPEED